MSIYNHIIRHITVKFVPSLKKADNGTLSRPGCSNNCSLFTSREAEAQVI